ncbi:LSM domain containing protein, putative [Babesia bigemina]|uniref:LSM domain containing protein, putative n=1 Tax=Babesia bigemina TaxID=5866 RepID=A0A061D0B2_BABBI|nr:LSM domain containing protein, putative [Babesia bigemina]CDR94266.1 LSM domain containing protein, putative [Babesia bigemina]|eukprot:XP_012766452.1 LSM domain containing protein, putative [Babesia bigemina]
MDDDVATARSDQHSKQQWIWVVEDELGSLIWVTLRDETYYVGIFKSFDQYGNLVLTDAVRKVIVHSQRVFSDVYCGNLIIRGESIAYFCGLDATSYLNTFKYNSTFDHSRLLQVARKRNMRMMPQPMMPKLKYVELDEALALLKEEQEQFPTKKHIFSDMLGNDAFA